MALETKYGHSKGNNQNGQIIYEIKIIFANYVSNEVNI